METIEFPVQLLNNEIMHNDQIIIYQDAGGGATVEVKLRDDTLWLTLNQLAELFERDKSVISRHLRNIFLEGELDRNAIVAKNATVQARETET
ncbi:hypothetical protein [Mucilaginibacter defluvii]|uniref:Virulence RhuM family protein n=1 Tax=Mucilaginibacter defluvii TaxID=1196019 RepID=A0ABP9FWF5_9SPHI